MASSLDDSRLQGHAERLVSGPKEGRVEPVSGRRQRSVLAWLCFLCELGKKYYSLTEHWKTYLHLVAICLMSKKGEIRHKREAG